MTIFPQDDITVHTPYPQSKLRLQRPLDYEAIRVPENFTNKASPDLLQIWDISTHVSMTQPTSPTRDDSTITSVDGPIQHPPRVYDKTSPNILSNMGHSAHTPLTNQ